MQYGFDAPFPDLFDETVGRKGHFQRTVESIHNCHNAGLSVRTNSILTSKSYRYIHELMDLLHTLPLFNMKFAPAFRSIHRPRPDLLLTEEQKQWLRAQIDLLKEKYPQGKINFECRSDYRDLSAEAREKEFHGFPRCGVNRFCMIVAPDGAVIGCEQAPQTADFILGNVKERSLLDVWQSDRVTGFINVTREQFKGTVCEDCETFAQCYDNKGGCFIESIRAYGSRFAPHPLCPKAPGYELAVH
jgi:radical SAM protein with 4Fe4S-binding SPASM domain